MTQRGARLEPTGSTIPSVRPGASARREGRKGQAGRRGAQAAEERTWTKAIGPLAAITVKLGRLTAIGPGGSVHEFQVIDLSSQSGLLFPIPTEVAVEVANRILALVPKGKPLRSMFPERPKRQKEPDRSGGEGRACD